MVWQKGIVQFQESFALFAPSVVSWLVPAVIMSLTVPDTAPEKVTARGELRLGSGRVVSSHHRHGGEFA